MAGRYKIKTFLGGGGFGSVFLAFDTELQEEVALKLLRPELTSNERILERFRREIRIARKLSHRNIVRLHELHREEDTLFFTMEHLQGDDLKSVLLRGKRLAHGQRLKIASEVCQGLGYAHSRHVIHRDIKSSNIFLTAEGVVKILDFGLSTSRESQGITDAGSLLGTPDYMSPEQVRGEPSTRQSDIYSLGVVLFELWTGELPFHGDTPMAAAVRRLLQDAPDPRRTGSGMPEEIARLVEKALARDRKRRFRSVEEMEAELRLCTMSVQDGPSVSGTSSKDRFTGAVSAVRKSHTPPSSRSTVVLSSTEQASEKRAPLFPDASAESRESLLPLVLSRVHEAREILVGPDAVSIRTEGGLSKVFDLGEDALTLIAELKRASDGIDPGSRGPQEGRLDLRSVTPGLAGAFRVFLLAGRGRERAVLRRLQSTPASLDPVVLGMPEAILESFRNVLGSPPGLVLIVGPARSGKTLSTLALASIASMMDLVCMCAQESVEMQVPGPVQVAVSPDEGLDYEKILDSFISKGAQVLMVDGGADVPWGLIMGAALQAAVVCATVEAPSVAQALALLLQAGARPLKLARAFRLAICQVLVPTVCGHCREPVRIDDSLSSRFGALRESKGEAVYFRGKGCIECLNTGKGRPEALFESVSAEGDVRKWIRSGCPKEGVPPALRPGSPSSLRRRLAGLVMEGKVAPYDVPSECLGPDD